MAWLSVDRSEYEFINEDRPFRNTNESMFVGGGPYIKLPSGTIEKIIGRVITWEDEPVEI
jgi:hypothetical protein